MTKEQQQVLEFHRTFGSTVNDSLTIPSVQDAALRANLMREELSEFHLSALPGDIVGVADALGDLLYVLLGTAITYGIDLEPVFREIHHSNMSKAWTRDEVDKAPEGSVVTQLFVPQSSRDRAFVVKRSDGKVLKSPSYSPANIPAVLAAQQKDA